LFSKYFPYSCNAVDWGYYEICRKPGIHPGIHHCTNVFFGIILGLQGTLAEWWADLGEKPKQLFGFLVFYQTLWSVCSLCGAVDFYG
jgi:hypothetical protein